MPANSRATSADRPRGGSQQFVVRLDCPTPLAHREMTIKAADSHEAWRQFCQANGISGSDHLHDVRLAAEGPASAEQAIAPRRNH